MTDYRKLQDALRDLADRFETYLDPDLSGDRADIAAIARARSLASSPPPDLEGPAEEEVEQLAKELFAAARNRWIWDSRNAETKNEWRCAAREAWRLGARTRRTP